MRRSDRSYSSYDSCARNSEQKIRRNRGGINGKTEFELAITELAMRIVVVAGIGDPGSLHLIFSSWTDAGTRF